MSMGAHSGPSVHVSAIVVRACEDCGGKRELGKPCDGCGSKRPPKATDLGVIASVQRSWWKRLKWNLWGYRAAQRRIARTNKEMCG